MKESLNNPIKFRRNFVATMLVLLFFFPIAALFRMLLKGGHPWAFGEWLINYKSGFVRRGLVGQLAITLFHGENILRFLFVFQSTLFLFFILYLGHYLRKTKYSWFSILVCFSPFGILMIFNDENLFIRKEFLGMLFLILVGKYSKSKFREQIFGDLLISIFFLLIVLASEVNLFFYLATLYLYTVNNKNSKSVNGVTFYIFNSLSLMIGLLLSIKFHGSKFQADSICKSLKIEELDTNMNCPGAIHTLGLSFSDAITHLKNDYPANLIFLPIFLLAIYPFIKSGIFKSNKFYLPIIVIGVVPLFMVAWDYGRWIFIIYTQLLIVFIEALKIDREKYKPSPYVVIVYICFLGIGHTGGNPFNNGWIALIPTLIRKVIIAAGLF